MENVLLMIRISENEKAGITGNVRRTDTRRYHGNLIILEKKVEAVEMFYP